VNHLHINVFCSLYVFCVLGYSGIIKRKSSIRMKTNWHMDRVSCEPISGWQPMSWEPKNIKTPVMLVPNLIKDDGPS
jgi:hypothetical protein